MFNVTISSYSSQDNNAMFVFKLVRGSYVFGAALNSLFPDASAIIHSKGGVFYSV